MGRQIALDAFALRSPSRVASFEVLEHPALIREVTGIDPFDQPADAYRKACQALGIDWISEFPRVTHRFGEGTEIRDLGDGIQVTEWGCSGSLWIKEHGFETVEEVLSYRPLEDDRGVRVVQDTYQEPRRRNARLGQAEAGDTVLVTGLYYTMLFQLCIMSFGWERFLEAAALDPAGFSVVLDQFAEISRRNVAAWAAEGSPVLFVHDDVAVTRGLVFSPEWYRREIFPRYEHILEPAFRAGRTVVFVSDGRFEELVDDLFALGIHGVMIDHTNDLAAILARHGERRSVIGSVDTGVLTRGTPDDVRREVDRCMRLGRRYPGFFVKADGDVPHNVPLPNALAYFAAKVELGSRG
jgi:hypothetical protein